MREYAPAQRELVGALVGLARALDAAPPTDTTLSVLTEALRALAGEGDPEEMLRAVRAEKARVVPDCAICRNPCGRTSDYDMAGLDVLDPALRELKWELLDGLVACARRSGPTDLSLLTQGLYGVGYDWYDEETLHKLVNELQDSE